MSTHILDTASSRNAVCKFDLARSASLAAYKEELAGLRFSILLTAKWEASEAVTVERRAELREELAILRSLYLNQMDDIAMSFGVQAAIDAKEEIERAVVLPHDMRTSITTVEWEELYF